MENEQKGFWKRTADWFKPIEVAPIQNRSVAIPDLTTNPPTWADFNAAYNGQVSVSQALAIPAVAASVRSIVTAVSQLDMTVQRQGVEIDSALVRQPDSNRSQSAFFKRTATNLVTTGNAYWRLYRNGDGQVVQMEALAPSRVLVRYNDAGTKFYEYADRNGKTVTLTNNLPTSNGQVEHIKLGEFEDEILGVGPIQINNAALYSIAELRFYTDRFLAESRRPSGIYAFDADMDEDELKQAKAQIMNNRVTGEPDALPKGVKYQSIMITPESAQLAELNKQAILEVARIFGIPPYRLAAAVDGNSMTYQNVGDADRAWVRESLEQYLTAIEDGMSNVLPRGQVAQFDTDNWLRAGAITTEGSASSAVTN